VLNIGNLPVPRVVLAGGRLGPSHFELTKKPLGLRKSFWGSVMTSAVFPGVIVILVSGKPALTSGATPSSNMIPRTRLAMGLINHFIFVPSFIHVVCIDVVQNVMQ